MAQTNTSITSASLTVLRPRSGWRSVDLRGLWAYRDLFLFLVWRDVRVIYAQSVLGIAWAVINPVVTMVVFSVIFGNLAGISSDGVPYPIFSFAALVPWTYFSSALGGASASLVSASAMIKKIYFPRMVIPLTPVAAKLVDFAIASVLLVVLMLWYRIAPTAAAFALPLLIGIMIITAAGVGMWLTALAVQYRDVKFAVPFIIQLWLYCSPVAYPTSLIPERWRLLYAVNPMVGVIEGFRSALLGTNPMPWDLIAVGSGTGLFMVVTGAMYFGRRERWFADVS